MPFTSLAFQTRLILCRLRNQQRIEEDRRANEDGWRREERNDEEPRAELEWRDKRPGA